MCICYQHINPHVYYLNPNKTPQRSTVYSSISWSFQTPKYSYHLTQNFLSSQIPASEHTHTRTHTQNEHSLKLVHVSIFRATWCRSEKILSLTARFWYVFIQMPVDWTLNLRSQSLGSVSSAQSVLYLGICILFLSPFRT